MATRRQTLTVEKMNRAIYVINTYLSSDTSRVFHEAGIMYLLKDMYNNMFNYIFYPVLTDFSDDIKLYFKYVTIVFYQPPRNLDGTSNYDTTYYFTFYYLKLALIFFKRICEEFKVKTLDNLTKDIQLTIQLGIHFIFEIIYNNYRHDNVEEYIQKMTNPVPENDFWKSLICGYLIETLIGLYAKDSFVIIHINGGPDIIDVENPDRIKFFEVKSSSGGNYGCQSFLKKNSSEANRPYDCLSIEQITKLDGDTVLRFHIQVNKLEKEPVAYICDIIKTIDIDAARLNDSIVICLKHLHHIFNVLTKFRDRKLSINLNSIQIKYKIKNGQQTLTLKPAQVLLNTICLHTWSYKTKIHDREQKNRISYINIGNVGVLPEPATINIRTEEFSKFLLESRYLDESPMIFNVHSIQPLNDPTYYPNLNQNGEFDIKAYMESLSKQVLPVLPDEQLTQNIDENLSRITHSHVIPPSLDYFDLYLRQNNIDVSQKILIYIINIGNQLYPYNPTLKHTFVHQLSSIIINNNPHFELILLHILYNLISYKQNRIEISQHEIMYILIMLIRLVTEKAILKTQLLSLSTNAQNIILSYNPDKIIRPEINGTHIVINVNDNIYNIL
jgi:hypothetical protein